MEMNKILFVLLLMLPFVVGTTQDVKFAVRGSFGHPVTKEALTQVGALGDIVAYYPRQWITNYVSTEIQATSKGSTIIATSKSEMLTDAQKDLLIGADLGTNIVIKVNYNYANSTTGQLDLRTMQYTATVVPEIQAEYIGGYEQMTQYFL
jgi:hypothetical protein